MLKKASGDCKDMEGLFLNPATKRKDHANSKLRDSEPGTSCSLESVDFSDIISITSEGDNTTPKKYIETGCLADGPSLITKN